MNRQYFLSSLLLSGAIFSSADLQSKDLLQPDESKHKLPPYLQPGDEIGITSPAGYISLAEIQPAVLLMQSWGYQVKIGPSIGKKDFTYGGTDSERTDDFQSMLDDPNLKAIMCARGGYGLVRIIDQLDFKKFNQHPKWIIGFSDVTVLHCHLNRNGHIATLHSKMCNSFPDDWSKADEIQIKTILSIRQALAGEDFKYTAPACEFNRPGIASGILVGGNLSIIENLAGTASDLDTEGKILFLEDTGEYLYSIDRMLWNLKRTGKLSRLAGLVIGGFNIKPDDPAEIFGKSIYEIVSEKIKDLKYPVCFNFPVGHQKDNFALRCGAAHQLVVDYSGSTLATIPL